MSGNKGKYILGYSFMAVIFASSLFFYFGWKNLTADQNQKLSEQENIAEENQKLLEQNRKSLLEFRLNGKGGQQSSYTVNREWAKDETILNNLTAPEKVWIRNLASVMYAAMEEKEYETLLEYILKGCVDKQIKDIFQNQAMKAGGHLGINYLSQRSQDFIRMLNQANKNEYSLELDRISLGEGLKPMILNYCFVAPEYQKLEQRNLPLRFSDEMGFLRNEDNLLLAGSAYIFRYGTVRSLFSQGKIVPKEKFDMTEFRKVNKLQEKNFSISNVPEEKLLEVCKNMFPYFHLLKEQIENKYNNPAASEIEKTFWEHCLIDITHADRYIFEPTNVSVDEEEMLRNLEQAITNHIADEGWLSPLHQQILLTGAARIKKAEDLLLSIFDYRVDVKPLQNYKHLKYFDGRPAVEALIALRVAPEKVLKKFAENHDDFRIMLLTTILWEMEWQDVAKTIKCMRDFQQNSENKTVKQNIEKGISLMKEGKHANHFHQTKWYQMYNDEILPDLLVKIEAGNTDLIPVFAKFWGREDLKTAADCRSMYDAAMAEYEAYLKEMFNEKPLP